MQLSDVKEITGYVVKALCNTLVHSLWQGLLLAALAGLIIICTRKSTPTRRYNLLIASLVLFTCTVTYTFIYQVQEVQVYRTMVFIKPHQLIDNTPDVHIKISTPVFTQINGVNNYQLISFLNSHSYTIVLIWFLVVFARSLQLMTGLHSLYYLRRRNIFTVDEAWQNRVKELAQQLGIKQLVHIAESGMAKVPMVIGHLKPLILIPVGLMTALSTDEIEAILVHELAHIRRRDYLVNLLVSLMEIVFFFNPAVLWISSLIKTERENCCDDIAVAQTSSKVNYIRALVSCQEYQMSAPAYAMAFSGRKNHLMGRVKRMVSNSNQSLNLMEKSLLALCLVTAGLLTTAFSNADKIDKLVVSTTKSITHITKTIKQQITPEIETKEPDSATVKPVTTIAAAIKPVTDEAPVSPATTDTIKSERVKLYQPSQVGEHTELMFPNGNLTTHLVKENGVLYQVNFNGKTLSSMQVNGKTIPATQYAEYMPEIASVLKKTTAETPQPIDEITPIKEPITPIEPISPISVNTSVDLSKLTTDVKLDRDNKSLSKLDAANQKALNTSKTRLAANQSKLSGQQAYLTSKANYDADKLKSYNASYNSDNYKPYDAKKDDDRREKLTAELIQQGVIQKHDELTSFKLSDTEFIVNGKKMPDDVYQKFKKEFVPPINSKKGSWSWMYNYNTETTVK